MTRPRLIKLLYVRVQLVHNGDEHRVDMSCDIPNSDYAQITHRTNTMRNFCIRVNASIPLPRRNNKFGEGNLAGSLFTVMVLVDSE